MRPTGTEKRPPAGVLGRQCTGNSPVGGTESGTLSERPAVCFTWFSHAAATDFLGADDCITSAVRLAGCRTFCHGSTPRDYRGSTVGADACTAGSEARSAWSGSFDDHRLY